MITSTSCELKKEYPSHANFKLHNIKNLLHESMFRVLLFQCQECFKFLHDNIGLHALMHVYQLLHLLTYQIHFKLYY